MARKEVEKIYKRFLLPGSSHGFYVKKEGKNHYLGFKAEDDSFVRRLRISKELYKGLLDERLLNEERVKVEKETIPRFVNLEGGK